MDSLVRYAVIKANHGVCFYCGDKAEHIDHIIPRSGWGSDKLTNLIPSCKACNLAKGKSRLEPKAEYLALVHAFIYEPVVMDTIQGHRPPTVLAWDYDIKPPRMKP